MTANNTKLKKSGILGFGIPAWKAHDGSTTCPNAWDCIKGCYAQHGTFTWPTVINAYERRFQLTRNPNFVDIMVTELRRRRPKYVRIHDSGDFYSPKYLFDWYHIIRACPDTLFYTYTKMVRMMKRCKQDHHTQWPKNFVVIYSEGGKEDKYILRSRDRHARIFPDLPTLQAAGYVDAHLDDLKALGKNPKIGLIYHGAKVRHFTTN